MKNNKGITLIALIITIIVMLILAAVAVNLSTGNNGIIKKAGEASKAYTDAEVEEKVELALLKNLFDENGKYIGDGLSDEQVKQIVNTALGNVEFIQDNIDLNNNSSTNNGNVYIYAFTYNSKTYNITSNWQVNVNIGNSENTTSIEDTTAEEKEVYCTYIMSEYWELSFNDDGTYELKSISEDDGRELITTGHYIIYENKVTITIEENVVNDSYVEKLPENQFENVEGEIIEIKDNSGKVINKILFLDDRTSYLTTNGNVGLTISNYSLITTFDGVTKYIDPYGNENSYFIFMPDGTLYYYKDDKIYKYNYIIYEDVIYTTRETVFSSYNLPEKSLTTREGETWTILEN